MGILQYDRKVSLILGGESSEPLEFSAFRVRFAVRRGDIQTPNSADIRIYNVSPDTSQRAEREFSRVILQAGYEGNYGVIFDGLIKQIRRGRESQTDTYLDITAADGDSAYNFAVVIASLAAGSTPKDHVAEILQGMKSRGITQGFAPWDQPGVPPANGLPRGKVLFGMCKDALRTVGKNTGTSWSIQDGALTFIPQSAYLPGDAVVVNAATGMIGLPEQTQNGIKVKTLLNPNIKIGSVIELDNESIQSLRFGLSVADSAKNMMDALVIKKNADGLYRVLVADHMGDTRGNDFYTDIICVAVDGTVPLSYIPKQGVGDKNAPTPVNPNG